MHCRSGSNEGHRMVITDPASYQILSQETAEQGFALPEKAMRPARRFPARQEIRLYTGGLHVSRGVSAGAGPAGTPYSVIVDGDLTVDGDLLWSTNVGGLLLVTGSVRAVNVLLSGCPEMAVRGNLTVANAIHGSYDTAGGRLTVDGETTARTILNPPGCTMKFASNPRAVLIGKMTGYPTHFHFDELSEVVKPDLLDQEGRADQRKIRETLSAALGILDSGVRIAPGYDVW